MNETYGSDKYIEGKLEWDRMSNLEALTAMQHSQALCKNQKKRTEQPFTERPAKR